MKIEISTQIWWSMGIDPNDPAEWPLMSAICQQIEQEIYYGDFKIENN